MNHRIRRLKYECDCGFVGIFDEYQKHVREELDGHTKAFSPPETLEPSATEVELESSTVTPEPQRSNIGSAEREEEASDLQGAEA